MKRSIIIFFFIPCSLFAFTKEGTIYTTDGSQSDVEAAITDADAADTINIPSGSFTWGASSNSVDIDKIITLSGAGPASTTIVISETSGDWTDGAIKILAAATLKSFTITGAAASAKTPISIGISNGWRVTDIVFDQDGSGYFAYAGTYGLFDNCTVTGNNGSSELIFTRGPTDSWQTADSLGGADNVFIEDCTFNGPGAATDFNSNGRGVVRFCTFNGTNKVDGHGLASNIPARGVRHVEVYQNNWTTTSAFWTAMAIRGGSGFIWGNTAPNSSSIRFELREYGCTTNVNGNFEFTYQTPDNYPVGYQVGTGQDVNIAATAITALQMVRIATVGSTDFTAIGASSNTVGIQFIATGAGTGTGTVDYTPATEPIYIWDTTRQGSQWPFSWAIIPQGAKDEYGADFTMEDIIADDRDYFREVASFDGTTGTGTGTASEMNAITPTLAGVGFWVTDEGEWNSLNGGADGRLYVWGGSSWDLEYTPYEYPHPLRGEVAPPQAPPGINLRMDGQGLPFLLDGSGISIMLN